MGPTKSSAADKRRYKKLKQLGCIVSRTRGVAVMAEIHHMKSGNKRMGNDFTIGLSSWYHRGVIQDGWTAAEMEVLMGPSMARNKPAFETEFGTEEELLAKTNELIESECTDYPFEQEYYQ